MIKNVIFDLGKVLIEFDFNGFYTALGYDPAERTLDEANEPILLFEAGKISKAVFFEEIKKIYGFDLSLKEFEILWCSVFSDAKEMIELARKISEKYNVLILSNTDEIHFPYIWKNFPQLHFFKNNLMLSYELNSVKPEKEIFKNAIEKFNLIPRECVFIDDRPINVSVAEKLGMKGIIHQSFLSTKEKLVKILTM
jgi:putative hydrolase of the HAD superfamily